VIAIIDYGVGNVASIANMCKKIGVSASVVRTPAELRAARRLILPGVGSFDHGMSELRSRGLVDPLNELVLKEDMPILGICLGMQLFAQASAEGSETGLGWIAARCLKFEFARTETRLKVPHMGWNTVAAVNSGQSFIPPDARFYFVHAYHLDCEHASDVAGETTYGYRFCSAVAKANIFGVQFHPEKSHRFGMDLLRRFVEAT
jgi:glutamine amidotransferase